MRIRHLTAPLVLLYWQLGPIPQPAVEPDGRVRWSLSGMAAGGQWEDATFDCDGSVIGSEPAKYHDIGGRVDVELPQGVRFSGVAGNTSLSGATPTDSYAYDYSTTTYGGMVAWEGQHVGLGGGVMHDYKGENRPSLYIRIGQRETRHFRIEVEPLSETRMMAGAIRMGNGFKNGFVGLTLSPYYQKLGQAALFGDVTVPVTGGVGVRLAGTFGPGLRTRQWGFGAGLRVHH